MVLRVVLFRLRPEATEEEYLALLSAFKTAVAGVPGLLRFDIGRRIDGKLQADVAAAGAAVGQNDYALVYQFASPGALRLYLRRPSTEDLQKQLARVTESVISNDYET